MKGTILIVDDERVVADVAQPALTKAGYRVRHVQNADSAFSLLKRETVDLLILDIDLPGISGLKLLEMLRQDKKTAALPIILLTVLGGASDKVKGLSKGADDYLAKPFSPEELKARVEALLRRVRRPEQPTNILEAGDLWVDMDRQEIKVNGARVTLRPLEFKLLALLMSHRGYVLSYATLSEHLSEGGRIMSSENLYGQIRNLRHGLGKAGDQIETVHGIGYKFIDKT